MTKILDYGYRSACCYAAIRLGTKKLKSGAKVQIWICTKCKKRDPILLKYTKTGIVETTEHDVIED